MIRASKPKTQDRRVVNRILHKKMGVMFEVIACPDDEFPRGAIFQKHDIDYGLHDGCWPPGMVFEMGGQRLRVVSDQTGASRLEPVC